MLLIVLAVNQSLRTCVNPQNSTQFSKLRNFVELSWTVDFKKKYGSSSNTGPIPYPFRNAVQPTFLKNLNFFWCADIKNNFKKIKKFHLDAFLNKKHFETQPLPQIPNQVATIHQPQQTQTSLPPSQLLKINYQS